MIGDTAVHTPDDDDAPGDGSIAAQPHVTVPQAAALPRAGLTVDSALPPGSAVGDYRILRLLGQSALDLTYAAEHVLLARQVVIQETFLRGMVERAPDGTVTPIEVEDRQTLEEMLGQAAARARIAASLDHPFVAGCENFLRANGTCYRVSRLVEGELLNEVTTRHRRAGEPLGEAELEPLFEKIFVGLEHVHDSGYLHGDLTPRDILVRPNGDPLILRIGLRPPADGDDSDTFVATPSYCAPEVMSGGTTGSRLGPHTDVFGLGGILYHAISGRAPNVSVVDRLAAVWRDEGDPYVPAIDAAANADLYSDRFLAAIDAALELNPQARPQSVGALRSALGWSRGRRLAVPEEEPRSPEPDEPARPAALHRLAGTRRWLAARLRRR